MKVFVTGVLGQLGNDCIIELKKRNIDYVGSDIKDIEGKNNYIALDITRKKDVEDVITKVKPDAIIHCAAWTNVDAAEDEENKELVMKINAEGTKNLADAAKKIGSKFVYISTDYVFNGQGDAPIDPDCKDFSPLNYYGLSKLEGEKNVERILDKFFIVRIAWVFGLNGNNFIKTMLKLSETKNELNVVSDQIGTPTYTKDLSVLLVDMILTEKYGFYHATNEGGFISWADFAKEIFKQANIQMKINEVTTKEYGISKAARPFNSRLDKAKLTESGFKSLPSWKDALRRYLLEINNG